MNKRVYQITVGTVLVLLLVMLGLLSAGVFYAMPGIDDFNFCNMLNSNLHYPRKIIAAFSQALWMYKQWQGAWFTNHLDMLAVGLTGLGTTGIRIYLMAALLLFVYSLFSLIYTLNDTFRQGKKRFGILSLLFILVFVGMNLTPCRELFYWLTGAGGYTIPFACAVLGIKNHIKLVKEFSAKNLVLASTCLALASGGALNVAGFGCAVAFCIAASYYLGIIGHAEGKKTKLLAVIPLLSGTVSAVVNVLSPGNFTRLEEGTGSGMRPVKALVDTVKLLAGRAYALYKNQYLILAAVLLFFLVMAIGNDAVKVTRHQAISGFVSAAFVLIVSFFPVSLGYGLVTSQERIVFLVDLELVMAMELCVTILAFWVKNSFPKEAGEINYVTLVPVLILLALLNLRTVGVADMMLYKTFVEVKSGTIREFCETEKQILSAIRESEDDTVTVNISYVNSEVALGLGAAPEESHWVNEAIATFYNKKSVKVNY